MNKYIHIWISLAFAIISSSLYSQTTCKLYLENGRLVGTCENTYIIKGFEIEIKEMILDSSTLFNRLPLIGKFTVDEKAYDSRYVSTENKTFNDVKYELTTRKGFPQIIIKTKVGWFTMDNLVVKHDNISFSINLQPTPLVTASDLKIIKKVRELLKSEEFWHKDDDRDCRDDIDKKRYSLFCALKIASTEVEGEYNHRNAIMQKVRTHINNRYPNKEFAHRLRDYNNMPETTYIELNSLLDTIENEVNYELDNKR